MIKFEFSFDKKPNQMIMTDNPNNRKYDNISKPIGIVSFSNSPLFLTIWNDADKELTNYLVENTPVHWGYFSHANLIVWACMTCDDAYYLLDDDSSYFGKRIKRLWLIIDNLISERVNVNQLKPLDWKSPLDYFSLSWADSARERLIAKGALSGAEILNQLRNNNHPYYLPSEDVFTEAAEKRYRAFQDRFNSQLTSDDLAGHFRVFKRSANSSFRPDLPHQVCLLDPSGYTLLMKAAHHGDSQVVSDLITWGSPINFCDHRGYTALFYSLLPLVYVSEYAIRNTFFHPIPAGKEDCTTDDWALVNIELVQQLLAAGADPNWLAEAGVTPLVLAVELGKWDIVDLLLKYGADINRRDQWGRTVLHTITGVLFERPSRFRQTFGELVFQYGSQRVFEYIIFPDEPQDLELESAGEMLSASNIYQIEDLRQLLSRGANVKLADNEGITPLDLAHRHRLDWLPFMMAHND